jgi:hypothetical protein
MTIPSDPQAAARELFVKIIAANVGNSRDVSMATLERISGPIADKQLNALAAAGLVITAPDAPAARPAGDRAKIDWTNDPITRSDIKKWQRALYDLRQTYYHPGIGMYPPYYRRCRAANLQAIRYLRLTGDHNPPLVTPAPGPGSEAEHA